MKKTTAIVEIKLEMVCPYCSSKISKTIDELGKVNINIPEIVVRGIVRKMCVGETEITPVAITCPCCFKEFVIFDLETR